VIRSGEFFHVFAQGHHTKLHYLDPLAHAGDSEAETGRLTAPMPGKIVALLVAAGQTVKKGDPLLIMEAMKMEHTISAPHDGTIDSVFYAVADQVTEGAQLLSFES
jgi:3-methylcrotonyl-CoA carboxylase alpha subunit